MNSMIKMLITIMVILIISILYFNIQYRDMTYIKSDIDDDYYLVRDLKDKQYACNMLSKIKSNILKITEYVRNNREKYPNMIPYIDQLCSRIKNVIIQESSVNSHYTSYSVNKGEQLVFCLRTSSFNNNLHDLNLLMYVVIHEMAHVGCPEYGHTPLFKDIFAFLCHRSIEINVYKKVDFNAQRVEYCGMDITDSII